MSRGRKQLPSQVVKMRGTDQTSRPRSEGVSAGKIDDISIAEMQIGFANLNERSREIFLERCGVLQAMRILEVSDLPQLMLYAQTFDTYLTAIADVERDGNYLIIYNDDGTVAKAVPHPAEKIRRSCIELLCKIGSDFGFSPVSRQKIKPQEQTKSLSEILNSLTEDSDEDNQ